jgi:hypothetical protein
MKPLLIVLATLLLPAVAAAQQPASSEDTPDTPTITRAELARLKQVRGKSAAGGLVKATWTHPTFVASHRLRKAAAKKEKRLAEPKQ